MNKKIRKKTLKGMTLIEVIIAMLVLVILAAILAVGASSVVSNVRASKSVIKKVNHQSKYVSQQNTHTGTDDPMDPNTVQLEISLSKDRVTPYSESGGGPIPVIIYEAKPDPDALYKDYDRAGNLKHFVIQDDKIKKS